MSNERIKRVLRSVGRSARAKAVLLAGAVWLVYSGSLGGPFVFDDQHVIVLNPAVRGPADVPRIFADATAFSTRPANRDYRPVFLTAMALCWWAGDGSTLPFHLVSVALHAANALLFFLVFRRMAARERDAPGRPGPEDRDRAAFLAAGLFAVHPLLTEAVNYVSSQSILWAGCFYLSSFYLFLTTFGEPAGRRKPWRLAGSCACYALALLSKPIAITLPVVLLLWEALFGGRAPAAGDFPRSPEAGLGRRLLKHLPYLGLTAGYLVLRGAVFPPGHGIVPSRSLDPLQLATQTKALVFYYLKLALWPAGLNHDRHFPVSTSLADGRLLVAVLVLGGFAWALFHCRRDRLLVFWALWAPICLSVTTYGVALAQTVREGRAYLSLTGLCAVVGLLALRAWRRLPLEVSDARLGPRAGRLLSALLAGAIAAALAAGTIARNRDWSSELRLLESAARNGGTWRAHMTYGVLLERRGRRDEAVVELRRAFEMEANAYTHLHLGFAYVERGDLEEGLEYLRAAVRRWGDVPETRLYLAHALEKAGQVAAAESELERAVRSRPTDLVGLQWLAELYQRHGRLAEATAGYRVLLEVDPAQTWAAERIRLLEEGWSPEGLFQQAFAAQRDGRRDEAIRLYQMLLSLEPEHLQGTFNLAYAYGEGSSATDQARSARLFERVLAVDPGYSEALFHLATAYWKLGREAEAIRTDRRYVQLPGAHAGLRQQALERLARAGIEY